MTAMLESRLASLERRCRVLSAGLGLCVICCLLLVVGLWAITLSPSMGATLASEQNQIDASPVADVVRAKRFEIIDDAGQVIGRLGNVDGEAMLYVNRGAFTSMVAAPRALISEDIGRIAESQKIDGVLIGHANGEASIVLKSGANAAKVLASVDAAIVGCSAESETLGLMQVMASADVNGGAFFVTQSGEMQWAAP